MPEPSEKIVNVLCPHCQAAHPVREQVLGRLGKCTSCGQRFVLRAGPPETTPAKTPSQSPAATPTPAMRADEAQSPSAQSSAAQSVKGQPVRAEPPADLPPAEPPAAAAPPTAASPQRTDSPEPSAVPPPFAGMPPAAPSSGEPSAPPRARSSAYASSRRAPLDYTRSPDQRQVPWPVWILRVAARIYEVLAVVSFGLAVLATLVMLIRVATVIQDSAQLVAALFSAGALLVWSCLVSILMFLFAQALRLALLIEENTYHTLQASRATAAACEALQAQSIRPSEPSPATLPATTPPVPPASPGSLGLEAAPQSP